MANFVITLDANGIGDQVPTAHGNGQDTVQWKATQNPNGTYPEWFIYFLDPFANAVIVTSASSGKSSKIAVCQAYPQPGTYCPYWTTKTDPRLSIGKKVRALSGPGGGIIIDN